MPAPEIVPSCVTVGTIIVSTLVSLTPDGAWAHEEAEVPIEISPDYSFVRLDESVALAAKRCLAGCLREIAAEREFPDE